MNNIKSLGNKQLSLYHETIYQKLNNIQMAIMEDITYTLGEKSPIINEISTNTKKFKKYYKKYQHIIQKEKKELFLIVMKQQNEIKEEIERRQKQLLKDIGIISPSMRVQKIIEETQGIYFRSFDEIIKYIKMARVGKAQKRTKPLYAPTSLIERTEKL